MYSALHLPGTRHRALSLFRIDREQFERDAAFVADHNAKSSDLVQLNIGGERFVTVPRSTLTLFPDSMPGAMFSGRHNVNTDEQVRAV